MKRSLFAFWKRNSPEQADKPLKLIIGLGNPGSGYARNRHNIGFTCISHVARTHGIHLDKKQGKARTGTGEIAGQRVVLARSQTFMNRSGQSLELLVKKFDIGPDDLVVIHDELDLPPGKIRLSYGVGSGGHKGIASIIDHLGSRDFTRLRVGIGRPLDATEDGIISYVLGDFTAEESRTMAEAAALAGEALHCLLTEGRTVAMNKYN